MHAVNHFLFERAILSSLVDTSIKVAETLAFSHHAIDEGEFVDGCLWPAMWTAKQRTDKDVRGVMLDDGVGGSDGGGSGGGGGGVGGSYDGGDVRCARCSIQFCKYDWDQTETKITGCSLCLSLACGVSFSFFFLLVACLLVLEQCTI